MPRPPAKTPGEFPVREEARQRAPQCLSDTIRHHEAVIIIDDEITLGILRQQRGAPQPGDARRAELQEVAPSYITMFFEKSMVLVHVCSPGISAAPCT